MFDVTELSAQDTIGGVYSLAFFFFFFFSETIIKLFISCELSAKQIADNSHEVPSFILSTVILSLPLIQEGPLSVSGERMCIILVNRLED